MKTIIKDDYIYLDDGYLELYIPKYYIEHGVSQSIGTTYSSLGLLNYKLFQSQDGKLIKTGVLNIPNIIEFYPSVIKPEVNMKIYDDGPEGTYTPIGFDKGDKLFRQYYPKDIDNVVGFTNLLLDGKIDNNIPYDMITNAWLTCMRMNGANFGVPVPILEVIVSGICRDAKDQGRSFAKVIGNNPEVSKVAYRPANIRSICASESVFGALTFEDMNAMIDASLNMTAKNKDQNISPVEKIIKY